MNKRAYVVLQLESVRFVTGSGEEQKAVVTDAGVYSESHPTTIGPAVQVVMAEAEGRDFEHAARMVAMVAVSRSWPSPALEQLFSKRRWLREALLVLQACRRADGLRGAALREAFIERGKVPHAKGVMR
jgi:hypothetical protein